MTEKEAFEQWHTNKYLAKEFGALTLQDAWQASLEWARSEQEPVACIGTNGELMWLKKPEVLYSKPIPLYTHPAPDAVRKLVEAAEFCRFALEPYDDIKPRDWKSDRENLRRAHQNINAALDALKGE